jgi:hypothetical protein
MTLLASSDSQAGSQSSYGFCSKNADGSGNCFGDFAGFRNNADPNAFISFASYGSFWASLNSVSYACSPNSTVLSQWPVLMNSRAYFSISWDAGGTCTSLTLINTSAHATF